LTVDGGGVSSMVISCTGCVLGRLRLDGLAAVLDSRSAGQDRVRGRVCPPDPNDHYVMCLTCKARRTPTSVLVMVDCTWGARNGL
jgi:hypothetical protein